MFYRCEKTWRKSRNVKTFKNVEKYNNVLKRDKNGHQMPRSGDTVQVTKA